MLEILDGQPITNQPRSIGASASSAAHLNPTPAGSDSDCAECGVCCTECCTHICDSIWTWL